MVRALLVIPFLLLPVAAGADAGQQQVRDQLVWDFAEFVHHFRGRNWEGVCRFVSERTKAGFGGETGCAGVRQVYADNEACWKEMVFALRQGCKRAGRGSNVSCIAPPFRIARNRGDGWWTF